MLLVDYERLVAIVWKVAIDARDAAALHRWTAFRSVGQGFIALAIVAIIGAVNPIVGIIACVVLLMVASAFKVTAQKHTRKAIADVRARALAALLEDTFHEGERCLPISATQVGNGLVGASTLVLTATEAHLFPGFGRLQAERLFVCRPKSGVPRGDVDAMIHDVRSRIVTEVAEQPGVIGRHGDVVIIHRSSLSRDSSWLQPDKAPILWLPAGEIARIHELDPHAAVRVFLATQVVIPRHGTIATFFTRIYQTGSGVSFHIAVTTLGPPDRLEPHFQRLLFQHAKEARADDRASSPLPSEKHSSEAAQHAIRRLDVINVVSGSAAPFQAQIDLDELQKLDPRKELFRSSVYDTRFQAVVDDCPVWPGRFHELSNLRENWSSPLPLDLFGRPEAIALVHLIHEQLTHAVLETIDAAGFDTSDYRDVNGRIQINAGKIEQLVVGDRVTMHETPAAVAPDSKAAPVEASRKVA